MGSSGFYILILVLALGLIAGLFVYNLNKPAKRLTPLAGLAFSFIIAGIFFGEKRMVGYSLIAVGVLLAVIDIFRKEKKSS